MPDSSPLKQPAKRRQGDSASDLDFPDAGDSDGDDDSDVGLVDPRELSSGPRSGSTPNKGKKKLSVNPKPQVPPKKRDGFMNKHKPTPVGRIITLHPPAKFKRQQGSVQQPPVLKSIAKNIGMGNRTESSVKRPAPGKVQSNIANGPITVSTLRTTQNIATKKIQDAPGKVPLRKNKETAGNLPAGSANPPAQNSNSAQAKLMAKSVDTSKHRGTSAIKPMIPDMNGLSANHRNSTAAAANKTGPAASSDLSKSAAPVQDKNYSAIGPSQGTPSPSIPNAIAHLFGKDASVASDNSSPPIDANESFTQTTSSVNPITDLVEATLLGSAQRKSPQIPNAVTTDQVQVMLPGSRQHVSPRNPSE